MTTQNESMDSFENKVREVVSRLELLHINDDYARYNSWNELAELLSTDEQKTIEYLDSCSESIIIDNISSVFMDISWKLQSKKFIDCIELLKKRFPDLLLEHMVEAAKNAMLDNEDTTASPV